MSSSMQELRARALQTTPAGVHSNVRMLGSKIFIERAAGARMWDVDGKEYVDQLLGQGPNFLGHAPPAVVAAVADATRQGLIFGGQHPLELEAAERMLEALAWPDQIRFGLTGTEAVQAVLRLARAATGRSKVLRFEGQYHGWLDNVLMAPKGEGWGVASAGQLEGDLGHTVVVPWNDATAVRAAFDAHPDQIAAIITEPAMINSGAIPPADGYLEALRSIADERGALLIFDEVITGFRLALGGGAERFGVTPDLAVYGKAMAGGFPAAAFAGRGDVMGLLASGTNHSGTLNGNVMSSAAVVASLAQLSTGEPYAAVEAYGKALMKALPEVAAAHGVELNVHGFPMAFHVSFGRAEVKDWRTLQKLDLAAYDRFSDVLVDHGIWVTGRGIWYSSAVHGDAELADVLERFERALVAWSGQQGGRT